MTSIFIISSGSYSDYQVHMAAATREEAEAILDKIDPEPGRGTWADFEIEEYPLVTVDDVAIRVRHEVWANVYDDGTADTPFGTSEREWAIGEDFLGEAKPVSHSAFVEAPRYQFRPDDDRRATGRVIVSGYDREAVLKAAADKLGQARAEAIDAAKARETAHSQLDDTIAKLAERMRQQRGEGS